MTITSSTHSRLTVERMDMRDVRRSDGKRSHEARKRSITLRRERRRKATERAVMAPLATR